MVRTRGNLAQQRVLSGVLEWHSDVYSSELMKDLVEHVRTVPFSIVCLGIPAFVLNAGL